LGSFRYQSRSASLIEIRTTKEFRASVDTAPEAFRAWLDILRQRYPQARIARCFEPPAGNLVALLE
jgi:hypothetical protein